MKEFFRLISHRKFKALFAAKTHNPYIQFFRYVFVGGFASVADWTALYVFYDLLDINEYVAIAISFLFGLFVNYILSKHFVFTDVDVQKRRGQFSVYFITGVIGLLMTEALMLVFSRLLDIHYMPSKIITTVLVFFWNFGSKKIILSGKRDKK